MMSAQSIIPSSVDVLTRIKLSLSELNSIFNGLIFDWTANNDASTAMAELRSPLPPLRSRMLTASTNNKDRVMQLLEGLKEDFGLVYSQGRRHTFKPSGFAQKLGSLHIKGRKRLRGHRHPGDPSTDDRMDALEGEKISLERNGTSWVWSATEHEAEWDCLIGGHNKIEGTEDAHVEFEIQTVMSSALYGQCQQSLDFGSPPELPSDTENVHRVTVFHRFNDFKTLFGILVAAYPYLCIPPLPPNRFAKLGEKLTLYRKRHLELWLHYFAMHPILSKAKYIHNFLFQNGKEWATLVNNLKASEKSIMGCVKLSVAYPSPSEKSNRIEIEMSTLQLETAIRDIGTLFVAEKKKFSEDLSTTYARYCAKLKELPSLLEENPEGVCAQSWGEIFSNVARIFNARASSLNSKTEHFDEINSILEEFSNMVKQLRKLATGRAINREKARTDETILKALSMEAEFHWVLKNQTGRLALELADFCESHAEFLGDDANLCREAVNILRNRPRYAMNQ